MAPSVVGCAGAALVAFMATSGMAVPFEETAPVLEEHRFFSLPFTLPKLGVSTSDSMPTTTIAGKPATVTGTLVTGSVVGQTTFSPGQVIPSSYYNPNGPIFNPADYTPLPFTWPGKPTAADESVPPRPSKPPFPTGGPNASSYQIPAWVSQGLNSLIPSLPQSTTNGNSLWGLLNCPTLNNFETGAACSAMPNTGVTRKYNFEVAYQAIAPDGVQRNGITINGGFPGPLIEANWGDWIQVTVTNNIPDEGTTIHWHGLLQNGTTYYDGVPAVSQCPIAPYQTYTYTFRADLYGTSWYHSHYSAQYNGGALGPIVIHGPKIADYDVDIGPVMLSDWYHQDYYTLVNQTLTGAVPQSNNNLINGKMNYPCANTTLPCTPNAGISKFRFQSGLRYRLRLINTGSEGIQKFTIDGHNFTVIANDFVPVQPYNTSYITLGVAQRTDVIVYASGKTGDAYWMRSNLGNLGGGCSVTDGISPVAVAAVYYQGANTNSLPTTNSSLTTDQLNDCGNDSLNKTVALCPITPDPNPPSVTNLEIVFGSNGTNFVWFMNNSTFRGDYNEPVLLQANQKNLTFAPEWNVFNMGSNSSVRFIVYNTFTFGSHPMHLHGHNFHVLAEGFGTWDGNVTNPSNTQRRDVQLVRPAQDANTPSFIVLQWTQDNPGLWPFHCHIAWHVSGGLYVQVLERPADVEAQVFPAITSSTCSAWGSWTNTNFVDQIDSGLKMKMKMMKE